VLPIPALALATAGMVAPSSGGPKAARSEDESSLTMKSSPSRLACNTFPQVPRYLATRTDSTISLKSAQGPCSKNGRSMGEQLIPASVRHAA